MTATSDPRGLAAGWRTALDEVFADPDRLRPSFQPIADLRRGTVCGYEALARFAGPGPTSPLEWFAAASSHGCADRLEALAIEAALRGRGSLPDNCFLSINVSPGAVDSERVQSLLLAEADLRGVVLEITEQSPVEDYSSLNRALAPLREAGATVAVDDAGAGYASMRHVLALEPQFVKLDRSLVSDVHADPRKPAAIAAIGAFAGELDAWIVAEGIETEAELDALVAMDIPLAQGYLLGRPGPTMARVAADIGRRIRGHASRSASGVGAHVQPAATIGPGEAEPPRADDGGPPEVAVRVDEFDRPLAIALARSGGVEEVPALCAVATEAPAELALRAMARPTGHRFVPIACCDERGRLLGLIGVDRLVEALARRGSSPSGSRD